MSCVPLVFCGILKCVVSSDCSYSYIEISGASLVFCLISDNVCFLRFLCFSIILCTFWCFVLSKIPVFHHCFMYFLVLCVVYDSCVSLLFCVLSGALCCLRFPCFSIAFCTFWCFVLSKIPVFLHYFVYFLVLCVVLDSCVSPLFCVLSRVLCCLRFLSFCIVLCTFWCFVLSKIPAILHYFVYFLVVCVI